MNRSLIIVKHPNKRKFYSVRIHWEYGQSVENWLKENFSDYRRIMSRLLPEGHRSTIKESYKELLDNPTAEDVNYWEHKTLKEAVNNCEHHTLAYFNNKWKFKHH